MRQSPETNKDFGYIVLPITISEGERLEDLAKSDRFKAILKVITSLSIQDERLVEELKTSTAQKKHETSAIIKIDEVIEQLLQADFEKINQTLKLVIWQRVGRANWLPFQDARSYVQSLNLKNQKSWKQFLKNGNLPPNVPRSPNLVYETSGWKGFGDWLGTNIVRDKDFWPFKKARAFARGLGLKSSTEWKAYAKSPKRNPYIPAYPGPRYANEGWKGYGDWLGTRSTSEYRSFKDAREYAHSLNLNSSAEWYAHTKKPNFPDDIPKAPSHKYKNDGWNGFPDWLGKNDLMPGEGYLPYEEARAFVHSLKLKNGKQWQAFAKTAERPRRVPAYPDREYKNKGWSNTADWIGHTNPSKGYKEWPSFEQAKLYAQSLNLKSVSEWRAFVKTPQFNSSYPTNPSGVYAR